MIVYDADDGGFVTDGPAPTVITGTPYPGQTLTSTAARQWWRNGVLIPSETGDTYVVGVNDIGSVITQGGANKLKVWHPKDEAGVQAVFLGNFGTPAESAAISSWPDQGPNGWHLTQGTEANQPAMAFNITGHKVVRFDGVNDLLSFPAGALGVLRNRNYGYVMASVVDRTPAAGNSDHILLLGTNASGNGRIQVSTRRSSTSNFAHNGRRLTSDGTFVQCTHESDGSAHVLTAFADYAGGNARIRTDGVLRSYTAYTSGAGASQDDNSTLMVVGGTAGGFHAPIDVAGLILIAGSSALTTQALWRLENYLASLHGSSITAP